jgi:hypothetical protein
VRVRAQRTELGEERVDPIRVAGAAGVVVVDAGVERGAPGAVERERFVRALVVRRG